MQAAPMDFERQLVFDGCFNFRDLGGYGTSDGRWVRPRRLYRADGPHALTTRDIAKLRALDLATVIDLRTPQEVTDRGCYDTVLTNAVEHHLPMIDVLPDVEELPGWIDPAFVARRYRDMLDEGRGTIAQILAILSDPSAYPVVFHCSAGKDRTGVIAAVLLGVLGVPDDTIVADYALSETAMGHLVDHYKRAYPDAVEQLSRVAPAMVASHPDAMAAFIEGVRRDYGSFDGFVAELGVGSAPRYLRGAVLA